LEGVEVTAQLKFTKPANPVVEVAVTVAVFPVLLPGVIVIGVVRSRNVVAIFVIDTLPVEEP